MKTTDTSEKGLEKHITDYLVNENKYTLRTSKDYNNISCLDEDLLFDFFEKTQEKAVGKLKTYHKDLYKQKIIKRLNDQIKSKGIIEVLRKGITDGYTAVNLKLFYDKPVSSYNVGANNLYQSNIFSVMRQVYYSPKNKKSLDMVIFINGMPVITSELKNKLTGQNVNHGIKQYKEDRDPNESIFNFGRLIVNFALDTENIAMCTELKGEKSFFLPFNKSENDKKAQENEKGITTDYLWKETLTKDSLTDILQNYSQIVSEEKEYQDKNGKKRTKKEKKIIFPRYHQLSAVRKLLADAKEKGAGQKYLIQHSAGSGKSNSITWLAHQLSGLHDKTRKNKVFDSVIVVTDRRILDKQIRENIKQFQQVKGVVEAITDGSKQLKKALEEGKKIIITTIQKFPFIVEDIGSLAGNNFAIIIDEAHSSLGSTMARKLNETLAKSNISAEAENDEPDDELTGEDFIRAIIRSRKMLDNASYFAFTATPKNKTLELFGVPYQAEGKTKFKAFHLYSMKQAIEEGFILDVLQNYTTYQSYYSLLKKIEDDPEYDKIKAQKKLRNFVESHEHAIKKKSKIMIDHFMKNVIRKKKIGGIAKAMMVTSSRKNAVKYKRSFDKYLKSINSPYKSIVAFSGDIEGETESSLNGFPGGNIPNEFKKPEYRFLLVANKFQTGFDQPLLHTMYVDKKLGGVSAVQTLSRLNRSHAGKEDTFILDFANKAEDIENAFKPYFESTILGEATDPNKLFDLQDALDNFEVYNLEQINEFSDKILQNVSIDKLHNILSECAATFHDDLTEDEQNDFRDKAISFVRLNGFLSQIVPFEDAYFERLFIFLTHLISKIGKEKEEDLSEGILQNINMDSYRLQLESTVDMVLEQGEDLQPVPSDMKGGKSVPDIDALSEILKTFNDKYGTEFEDSDKVRRMAEAIKDDMIANEELQNSFKYSDEQNAKITSDKVLSEEILNFININFELYKKYSDDNDFKQDFNNMMFGFVKEAFLQSGDFKKL